MQYSALAQIDATNVSRLEQAWFYPVTGDPARLPFNPIVVDGVMYVAGAKGMVVALDAATGTPIWTSTEQAPERGLTYWENADRSDRRLLLNTGGGLRAIDATNGTLIKSFGRDGFVDMRTGEPRRLAGPNKTPGRIFENLIVVGSNTGEGYGSPPGDLRAYDVVTGRLVWTFHTIPRPGEFGSDTWPPDAWKYAGGATRGEKSRSTARTASCSLRRARRRTISTARIAAATTCLGTACSRSTRAPASGCGISRPCTMICGTTISPRRPSS